MTARPVQWGVIGATSTVARLAVIPALRSSHAARLVALTSQSAHSTELTAPTERFYSSYDALLEDPDVEAVYVPLPNSLHHHWSARAALAGKHVLCEKPLARSADEAALLINTCSSQGIVLMEAYMTPFHPRSRYFHDLVTLGCLGEARFARAAFTGVLQRDDDYRWDPSMGGGALLDLGIYCLSPLLAIAQRSPKATKGSAVVTPSGVDASFSGWLDFGEGLTASFECSFEAPERQHLEVVGTHASLWCDRAFTPGPHDTAIFLQSRDGNIQEIGSGGADPYSQMIEHMADVVRRGVPPQHPLSASVEVAGLIDRLRGDAGIG